MPAVYLSGTVYKRVMKRTNNKPIHTPDKITCSMIIEQALDDQQKYKKIMENVI